MLREIQNAQQVPGEPRRRSFFSHEMDLLVWFGDDGEPIAFQLCYGKYRDEHAIRWKNGQGFAHYRVDDGEGLGIGNDAPILVSNGDFKADRVLSRFRELSAEIPAEIAKFVIMCLRTHPEYSEEA